MYPYKTTTNSSNNKRPLNRIDNSNTSTEQQQQQQQQPKPTGKLSSLSRQWSSNEPQPPKNLPSSQPPPQSSSQPSWQLDQEEWPPTPPQPDPPSKKPKPNNNNNTYSYPTSAIRYPPQNQNNQKKPLDRTASANKALPWEIPAPQNAKNNTQNNGSSSSSSSKSIAFNQLQGIGKQQKSDALIKSHLNNPNMSIAAKVNKTHF
jgi:hypothetical protein